jgi:hypothetical protein
VPCKIFLDFSKTVASLPDRECVGFKPHETEVCSERPSCGIEQALADASIAKDLLMRGHTRHQLLPLTDRHMKVTNSATTSKPFSYRWKSSGFSSCTSSCLGGLQESLVTCVVSGAGTAVLPYFCDPNTKPEIEVRVCNEKACPPRWNITDFGDCSKSCGGGVQTRDLHCVQEVRWPFYTAVLFVRFVKIWSAIS